MYMGLKIKLDAKMILLEANLISRITSKQVSQINRVLAIAKSSVSKYRYGPCRPVLDIYQTDSKVRGLWLEFQ